MNRMGSLTMAAIIQLVGFAGVATTLNLVKQRGALNCGVNTAASAICAQSNFCSAIPGSKARYLGIEVDDSLAMAEQFDI
jgi:hypothetical protein